MNTPLESATRDQIAAAIAEIISAAVAEIAENRAVIDQAKGMLILLYGVDDQTAFDTLRWHSQNTNIKLRALAEQLVSNYRALSSFCSGVSPGSGGRSRPAWASYSIMTPVPPRAPHPGGIQVFLFECSSEYGRPGPFAGSADGS